LLIQNLVFNYGRIQHWMDRNDVESHNRLHKNFRRL
jgi:hypothetical protein